MCFRGWIDEDGLVGYVDGRCDILSYEMRRVSNGYGIKLEHESIGFISIDCIVK